MIRKLIKAKITEKSVAKNIDSIKQLLPNDLEEFFYWFYHTNMCTNLFDDTGVIRVHKHKAVSKVIFYYLEKGSYCEFLLQDTDNPSNQKVIGLTIEDSIKVKEISTYSGFKSGWNVKFYEFPSLSNKVYPALFAVIKNLVRYSIVKRIALGGNYAKTIPDKFLGQQVQEY